MLETVLIDKLVHGGQALGTLPDGRKVLVWNALPGEKVNVRLTKSKSKYAEGIAEEILEASPNREQPKDAVFLSTSPWQITTFESENKYKQEILTETIAREKVNYSQKIDFYAGSEQWHYRSKMEYSFWADDNGLHLALFNRGSHGKQIVEGSSIARPEIDELANKICILLNANKIRGSQLKTVVVRCNQAGECVAALFVKDENFPFIGDLEPLAKGLAVYFSNPKSPASVLTKELYSFGDITLVDSVLDTQIKYDVNSFFQVNLPVFEQALQDMLPEVENQHPIIDFYSGVGTIGVPLQASALVESDSHNAEMAKSNTGMQRIKIIKATAEKSLDCVPNKGVMIVDPPRAGLHAKLTQEILHALPEKIIYLSCNPITQARDLALLQDAYEITRITGYNFFPRTPHIESLAILVKNT